ncbi:uncharacterized protein LOC119583265 [Penaeus monodon]|uniref:uncharacterized protein LOC119583265 n=1 Tax=Penaeus monodon TaxID=6687 RepID=UPI0018A7B9A8|nr:uncharacterized protein LOC119583265 [Penaeus monodon]
MLTVRGSTCAPTRFAGHSDKGIVAMEIDHILTEGGGVCQVGSSWQSLINLQNKRETLEAVQESFGIRPMGSKYGKTALDIFRRTEKLSYRSKKLQKDIKFLNYCRNYNVIPKFLNFRVHNPVFESTITYRSWCFLLLDKEITSQKKKNIVITKKLQKDLTLLKSVLSPLDHICISRLINNNVHNKLLRVDNIHSKKLLKLGIDVKRKVDKNKVIFNFSDRILTEEQKDILSHGLDYCMPPNMISFHKFYLYFEKLCIVLKSSEIYNNTLSNVTNNITTIANNTFRKFSRQIKTNDAEVFTLPLQPLKNDETILITRPDKGRGVVILNKHEYHQKMLNILNDHTKLKKITTDISTHLLYLEDKLKRLLRMIKSSIGENTYNFLSTSGSQPGLLYGLPKVHKPNIPLRPIISSIGTFNYNTAKFLVPILSPLTSNKYTIDNSTSFANEITSLDPKQPVTMASFDVESLFTNVPLLETTDIITNNI